ncbi:hypothetical protein [Aquibacillus kalidii]|uniref:hypothetical protein n=1 Tax=Aquibacillus kalidii TaxID=2762597 RepID=UPI00164561D5|nr:hypothetical protein [Aquibacillus kalidii]
MKKRTIFILILLILLMGVTGCMSEVSSQEAILTYLEEKYDEKFEVEAFKEGSDAFKQMYGADKVIVHPEGKPEHVFLAGEYREHDGKYYDNYILSIWSDELTKHFEKEISEILTGVDYEYRILLYVVGEKYDKTMIEMSVFDYLANVNHDADIILNLAVKENQRPNIDEYSNEIYDLYKLINSTNTESNSVSIGFVDKSTDVKDYIRTSAVNNVPWSNMIGKMYGTLAVHKQFEISDSSQIAEYYQPMRK